MCYVGHCGFRPVKGPIRNSEVILCVIASCIFTDDDVLMNMHDISSCSSGC